MKKFLILFLLLILLGVGGGVYWFLFAKSDAKSAKKIQRVDTKERRVLEIIKQIKGPYYRFASMTLKLKNLRGERKKVHFDFIFDLEDTYLKYELDAKSEEIEKTIKEVLTSASVEYLYTDSGKLELENRIKERINAFLVDGKLKRVLIFTHLN